MARIITICSQKGGTGKTTTATNLGVGLAREGKKVLMVDFDPQGDTTTGLGFCKDSEIENLEYTIASALKKVISKEDFDPHECIFKCSESVDLIPANAELCDLETLLVTAIQRERVLQKYLVMISSEYDYIICDCLPSLGVLTINALTAANELIIPLNAAKYSFKALGQLIRTYLTVRQDGLNPSLKLTGILLTMVRRDNTYTPARVSEIKKVTKAANIPLFNTYVPFSICYERCANHGKSIYMLEGVDKEYKAAYANLVKEVIGNECI